MELYIPEATVHAAARALCDDDLKDSIGRVALLLVTSHLNLDGMVALPKSPESDQLILAANDLRIGAYLNWVKFSNRTYQFARNYGVALCIEYAQRFGRGKISVQHILEDTIATHLIVSPHAVWGNQEWLVPPQDFPHEFVHRNWWMGHRHYYVHRAASQNMVWTKRNKPAWFRPTVEYRDFYHRAYS